MCFNWSTCFVMSLVQHYNVSHVQTVQPLTCSAFPIKSKHVQPSTLQLSISPFLFPTCHCFHSSVVHQFMFSKISTFRHLSFSCSLSDAITLSFVQHFKCSWFQCFSTYFFCVASFQHVRQAHGSLNLVTIKMRYSHCERTCACIHDIDIDASATTLPIR